MMKHSPFVLLFVFILAVVIGCKPEPPKATVATVVGEWVVQAAKRNERKTQLLEGTYFVFAQDGNMRSNLPLYETPNEWVSPFELTNDTTLRFGTPPMNYTLKNWSDTTLELEFSTRGLPFWLLLKRAVAPVGPQDSIDN
jgi:hypothetical protein